MKCTVLLGFCTMIFLQGMGQNLRFREFTNLLDLNQKKLESHIQKKGFERTSEYTANDQGLSLVRYDRKPEQVTRCFQILPNEGGYNLVYQTTSLKEYADLQKEIKAAGFSYSSKPDPGIVYYQKQSLELICQPVQVDTAIFYRLKACRKKIPRLREIVFAEDLLQFDSHNYLVEVFGKGNVRSDSIYFSDSESTRCSIIFPNSSRQAIYLWKDADNMRGIYFILFGDQTTHSPLTLANTVLLSNWRSKQGVYCGMSLRELQAVNKEPVNFFNWRSELAGNVAPGNSGAIDFQKLKILFACMNCGYLNMNDRAEIIGSEKALAEDQKIYVTSFFILPEK